MIFPFGIEKEAEIYCTSTKVALAKQAKEIESQIAEMASNLAAMGTINLPYSTILQLMVTWTEQAVKTVGWDINNEDGVSWWIGLFAKSYIQAKNDDTLSFDKIFKTVFTSYFKNK
ncbi:MAG: hypothetical protein J6K28_05390 [Alistipes sp.]|nr:hypothetical protein [Alistipes sp.]